MNKDILQGKFHEIKGQLKQKWGKLTDDDLTAIEGNSDELYGRLQQYYGLSKEEAKKELEEL